MEAAVAAWLKALDDVSGPRRLIIAFNPAAGGRTRYEALRRVATRLSDAIATTVETSVDGAYQARLREAIREVRATGPKPTIVVVGGDGAVSMTLGAMADPADAVIAVVPAGSGNDFADALGCAGVDHAIAAIQSGFVRDVDFGMVNGRRFVNCVGMGLDADVGALSARFRARGYPSKPSYYGAALVGLFMVKPVGVTVAVDGVQSRYERGVMVTVGNGDSYGGGFRGAPGALLDDGLLDAYVFTDIEGLPARLALMRRIRAGTHPGQPNVAAIRSPGVRILFDREVAMHVDGEISAVRHAEISVVPRGLRVIAAAVTSPVVRPGGSGRAS